MISIGGILSVGYSAYIHWLYFAISEQFKFILENKRSENLALIDFEKGVITLSSQMVWFGKTLNIYLNEWMHEIILYCDFSTMKYYVSYNIVRR